MTEFAGRTVLVTGAASGIGRLMAREIAAAGAHVVLWDLDEQALTAFGRELAERGLRATTYRCDVSRRAEVAATARRVLEECGAVDVLINNAGVVSGKPLLELSDEAIERTFAVNALSLFWTARAFLPGMIQRGAGHIVTIASAAGLVGTARQTDYCASKHAAVGFDDALRVELRHLGHPIRTTLVCPYYIGTGMFAGVRSRILPILDPERTVHAIVRAIRRNRERVFMPRLVGWTYLGRLLPTAVFDAMMRAIGIDRSMDAFRGRGGDAAEP
jgi:all-trans-retinol dehydrogenase (NAD+)